MTITVAAAEGATEIRCGTDEDGKEVADAAAAAVGVVAVDE